MDWQALDIEVDAAACEAVAYSLMEAGALGTETVDGANSTSQVTGYFSNIPDREVVRYHLAEALRIYNLPSSSVREMNLRAVVDRDWLAEWKRNWQPVEVGRFVIAPPWIDVPASRDRLLITIEPGMAFGTGTHETTRLCLVAIEKYFEGNSFLDVGTGTGVLAIAAAKLRPAAHIEACDTDAEAISVAVENAKVNNVEDRISFRVGSIDEATASADLVCANLTAGVIVELIPKLLNVTCGRLVLSGILTEQLDFVLEQLFTCGVSVEPEVMRDGEWIAIVV